MSPEVNKTFRRNSTSDAFSNRSATRLDQELKFDDYFEKPEGGINEAINEDEESKKEDDEEVKTEV
eukprot:CAMPEP_0176349404 /NCGR_PEP_ID=MMETSP0126-20121128/8627_1 /TAXON_ID=141414 ORGANISM="Strombidinopsis acuminatum, Strain SPMC142" /NCGR_SAMPLE_ID=MMETSP0126 /ASSEMBLY_ACC=CAM_ASM_000229 /LENGTH=65 /DNA_ID=CAMNT_0017698753 /DNA_START=424 /DNA_END=621 /DNA_ORIENTATION=-